MLPMQELRTLCTGLGLTNVRTYIQSGNVVFESRLSEAVLRTKLEAALSDSTGHRVSVMVRTASELRATLDANPFPDARPAQVGVVFLSASVPEGSVRRIGTSRRRRAARRQTRGVHPLSQRHGTVEIKASASRDRWHHAESQHGRQTGGDGRGLNCSFLLWCLERVRYRDAMDQRLRMSNTTCNSFALQANTLLVRRNSGTVWSHVSHHRSPQPPQAIPLR